MDNSKMYNQYDISLEDRRFINSLSPKELKMLPKYQELREVKNCKNCEHRYECHNNFSPIQVIKTDTFTAQCLKKEVASKIIGVILSIIVVPFIGFAMFKLFYKSMFFFIISSLLGSVIVSLIICSIVNVIFLSNAKKVDKNFYLKQKEEFFDILRQLEKQKSLENGETEEFKKFLKLVLNVTDDVETNIQALTEICDNINEDKYSKEDFLIIKNNGKTLIAKLEEFNPKISPRVYLKTIPFYKEHLANFNLTIKQFIEFYNKEKLTEENIENFKKILNVFNNKLDKFISEILNKESEYFNKDMDKLMNIVITESTGGENND